eukprot:1295047-Prymnesium_polylepis.2
MVLTYRLMEGTTEWWWSGEGPTVGVVVGYRGFAGSGACVLNGISTQGGVAPEQGGVAPERGGVAPEQGGVAPERGGVAPEQDGVAPEQGGVAPEQDGVTPEQDGAAPEQHGAAHWSTPPGLLWWWLRRLGGRTNVCTRRAVYTALPSTQESHWLGRSDCTRRRTQAYVGEGAPKWQLAVATRWTRRCAVGGGSLGRAKRAAPGTTE